MLEDIKEIHAKGQPMLIGTVAVETSEINDDGKTGSAHNLCYFPTLNDIKNFSNEMKKHIKNITLSSQRANISGYELIDIVEKNNGILFYYRRATKTKINSIPLFQIL